MTTEAVEGATDVAPGDVSGSDSDESGKSTAGKPAGDDNNENNNRLKRRNDELAAKLKAEKERADATAKQLAAIESEKKTAAEKLAEEEGRWQDVIKAEREKNEALKAELAERDTKIASLNNANVERSIIDRLAEVEGLTAPRSKVSDIYRGLAERHGLDRFPATDSLDKEIDRREKLLRKEYPELFGTPKPKTTGGSPPQKGKPNAKDNPWSKLT